MRKTTVAVLGLLSTLQATAPAEPVSRAQVLAAMQKATQYFRTQLATQGGYVHRYTLDLKRRWGEGEANDQQIWLQPPGTPTVGQAFLQAYAATGQAEYLTAAKEMAGALRHGQLRSGGWTYWVDFDPKGAKGGAYRLGGSQAKRNVSTLDDDTTQSVLRFLIRLDQTLAFKDADVHDTTMTGLTALMAAQYPNGGFPQGWEKPAEPHPTLAANYPGDNWRTKDKGAQYWLYYTLNDNLVGRVTDTLLLAHEVYQEDRFASALRRLGDFLILAQMPDPQPAWCQQYNFQMQPAWARKFEPPAVTGNESQDAIETLIKIYWFTRDAKYLVPIPRAVEYLNRSKLPDGRLARFYEVKTNTPLYFVANEYTLTYDDGNVPNHYGFKVLSDVRRLQRRYEEAARRGQTPPKHTLPKPAAIEAEVQRILADLDSEGRWVSLPTVRPDRPVKDQSQVQPTIKTDVYAHHIERLCQYLHATQPAK